MDTTKAALRREAMARRAAARREQSRYADASLAAVDLTDVLPPPPARVASYRAIGDEIDPAPLEARLLAAGYVIGLPAMAGKTAPLVFRTFTAGDPLAERAWGIREPLETAPLMVPDVLLVPLLAVDRAGWRLGYGGGYYDRTLRALRARKTILAIGLAFDAQRVDAVPHLDYDERLDLVLTPSGLHRSLGS